MLLANIPVQSQIRDAYSRNVYVRASIGMNDISPLPSEADSLEAIQPETPEDLSAITSLISEESMARLWDTPEEDEAWRDL